METFRKISASIGSSKEIAGLNKKKKNNDDDGTKFVKSRLAVLSRGELTVRMNLLGTCIARDGPDSSYLGVKGLARLSRRGCSRFLRGSREISSAPSLHRASTDALIYH